MPLLTAEQLAALDADEDIPGIEVDPPPAGGRRRKSRCPQGHAYAGDNLYTWADPVGGWIRYRCRACVRDRARARRARRR